ncbi:hypothetical protein FJTKL_09740 [Diaporthe vaccinii]|uniref:Uncharacterized protein n=1 Tax=Diaporthe vaccinii TaxID=105482 RepID=A0ABR4EMP0_9PEZI
MSPLQRLLTTTTTRGARRQADSSKSVLSTRLRLRCEAVRCGARRLIASSVECIEMTRLDGDEDAMRCDATRRCRYGNEDFYSLLSVFSFSSSTESTVHCAAGPGALTRCLERRAGGRALIGRQGNKGRPGGRGATREGKRRKGLMAMDHRCDDRSRFACALSPRSVWVNQVEALDDGR